MCKISVLRGQYFKSIDIVYVYSVILVNKGVSVYRDGFYNEYSLLILVRELLNIKRCIWG